MRIASYHSNLFYEQRDSKADYYLPLCYINSLPDELMCIIFELVVVTYTHEELCFVKTPKSDIIAIDLICQVSKQWERICDQNRRLWASALTMDSDSVQKAEEIVRRSGCVPLVIGSTSSKEEQDFDNDIWRYAFSQQDSWGTLTLHIPSFVERTALNASLTRSALKLRVLKIHLISYTLADEIDVEPGPFLLPDQLFARKAPGLREISLVNVYFPPSFEFTEWKDLTIFCVHHDVKQNYNEDMHSRKWLEILSAMPRLEMLFLGWDIDDSDATLPVFESTSSMRTTDIYLNHLSHLQFAASNEGAGGKVALNVFSKLIIPTNCFCTLAVHQNDLQLDTLQSSVDCHVKRWLSCGVILEVNFWSDSEDFEYGFDITAPAIKDSALELICKGSEKYVSPDGIVTSSPLATIAAIMYKIRCQLGVSN